MTYSPLWTTPAGWYFAPRPVKPPPEKPTESRFIVSESVNRAILLNALMSPPLSTSVMTYRIGLAVDPRTLPHDLPMLCTPERNAFGTSLRMTPPNEWRPFVVRLVVSRTLLSIVFADFGRSRVIVVRHDFSVERTGPRTKLFSRLPVQIGRASCRARVRSPVRGAVAMTSLTQRGARSLYQGQIGTARGVG